MVSSSSGPRHAPLRGYLDQFLSRCCTTKPRCHRKYYRFLPCTRNKNRKAWVESFPMQPLESQTIRLCGDQQYGHYPTPLSQCLGGARRFVKRRETQGRHTLVDKLIKLDNSKSGLGFENSFFLDASKTAAESKRVEGSFVELTVLGCFDRGGAPLQSPLPPPPAIERR